MVFPSGFSVFCFGLLVELAVAAIVVVIISVITITFPFNEVCGQVGLAGRRAERPVDVPLHSPAGRRFFSGAEKKSI